jgi:hypothetical protein
VPALATSRVCGVGLRTGPGLGTLALAEKDDLDGFALK